ncbi:MAG: DNA mismatch repair endonuclease MutL, partial [Methanolinea sp.]
MPESAPGGKIRILDGETVARIAAGEVIERPASVVKELVENAIDAGARTIVVEIRSRGGTIDGIRVTDDGCGMSPEDAALACTRHATSKIARIEDLHGIRSLGFRGEALASIAAISRLTLTTRVGAGQISGTRVEWEGGRLVRQEECGCPPGTTVEVRDLFYNTPARRKFMRSLGAEMAYITGTLERTVLSHPGISFHVLHNGRTLISAPAGTLRDAALHLFGVEWERALLPVDYAGNRARIAGLVSRPSFSRQNPYQIFISVNGRPVVSRSLALAVREGYGTLLPADRFPVAILDISVDPATVDPNVHPTKREVRIAGEEEVREEIARAVGSALGSVAVITGGGNTTRFAQQRPLPLSPAETPYGVPSPPPGFVSEPCFGTVTGRKGGGRQAGLGIQVQHGGALPADQTGA